MTIPSELPEYLRNRIALKELISRLPLDLRVQITAMLSDGNLRGWLVAVGDEAVYELTRESSYEKVARRLGVSKGIVNRRVCRYKKCQSDEYGPTVYEDEDDAL